MVHAVDRVEVPVVNDDHSWTQLRRFQHFPAPEAGATRSA
jgi:hypothetical protein